MNLAELTRMYDLTGKTFVVTGGTGVLCGAMAQALVGCGANVALLARNQQKGEAMLATMSAGPGKASLVFGDVLQREALEKAKDEVLARYGRIDGLINGAGGNHPQATAKPGLSFFDLPEDALRYVMDLNLLGTMIPTQVFARPMSEQGDGVILNVSSMAAIRPMTRVVGYAAAKAGITNFTQWLSTHLAQEYSPRIRVNAIAPGFFLGEQNRALLIDQETGKLTPRGEAIIAHTPMARFGNPEDLLGATLWLLSPASAFVTGIVVPVDGGFSSYAGV